MFVFFLLKKKHRQVKREGHFTKATALFLFLFPFFLSYVEGTTVYGESLFFFFLLLFVAAASSRTSHSELLPCVCLHAFVSVYLCADVLSVSVSLNYTLARTKTERAKSSLSRLNDNDWVIPLAFFSSFFFLQ